MQKVQQRLAFDAVLDYVRNTKGGRFTYSTAGVGTTEHLSAEFLFRSVGGLEGTHVPFQGGAAPVPIDSICVRIGAMRFAYCALRRQAAAGRDWVAAAAAGGIFSCAAICSRPPDFIHRSTCLA